MSSKTSSKASSRSALTSSKASSRTSSIRSSSCGGSRPSCQLPGEPYCCPNGTWFCLQGYVESSESSQPAPSSSPVASSALTSSRQSSKPAGAWGIDCTHMFFPAVVDQPPRRSKRYIYYSGGQLYSCNYLERFQRWWVGPGPNDYHNTWIPYNFNTVSYEIAEKPITPTWMSYEPKATGSTSGCSTGVTPQKSSPLLSRADADAGVLAFFSTYDPADVNLESLKSATQYGDGQVVTSGPGNTIVVHYAYGGNYSGTQVCKPEFSTKYLKKSSAKSSSGLKVFHCFHSALFGTDIFQSTTVQWRSSPVRTK